MVDWDRAADRARGMVSAVFDTFSCRMIPMTRGVNVNARPMEDLDRGGFVFAGLIELGPSQDAIPRHLPADTGTSGTMVSYDAVLTALTDDWPVAARKGDIVVVLAGSRDIPAGSRFEIMASEEDGSPRRAFYLNRRN